MSEAVSAQPSAKKLRGIAARSRPGMERVGGRATGTPNKWNGDIKRMVTAALELAGGVQYLCDQAHKNPVAFLGLVGRVLPLQVTGADGGRLQVEFRWADAPPQQPVIEANAEPAQLQLEDDRERITVSFATDE